MRKNLSNISINKKWELQKITIYETNLYKIIKLNEDFQVNKI